MPLNFVDSPTRALAAVMFVCIVLPGCGTMDGSDPYALWSTYNHPEDLYHFHYLSPPFERSESIGTGHPVFLIDPDDAPLPISKPGGDVRLEAWASGVQLIDVEIASRVGFWTDLGYPLPSAEVFVNRVGDEGVLLKTSDGKRVVREVLFEGDMGVVMISIWGAFDPLDRDIGLVMDGFEPRSHGKD